MVGLEKERDFYFGKLRDIEVLCQETGDESSPLVQKILDILYATEVQNVFFNWFILLFIMFNFFFLSGWLCSSR